MQYEFHKLAPLARWLWTAKSNQSKKNRCTFHTELVLSAHFPMLCVDSTYALDWWTAATQHYMSSHHRCRFICMCVGMWTERDYESFIWILLFHRTFSFISHSGDRALQSATQHLIYSNRKWSITTNHVCGIQLIRHRRVSSFQSRRPHRFQCKCQKWFFSHYGIHANISIWLVEWTPWRINNTYFQILSDVFRNDETRRRMKWIHIRRVDMQILDCRSFRGSWLSKMHELFPILNKIRNSFPCSVANGHIDFFPRNCCIGIQPS